MNPTVQERSRGSDIYYVPINLPDVGTDGQTLAALIAAGIPQGQAVALTAAQLGQIMIVTIDGLSDDYQFAGAATAANWITVPAFADEAKEVAVLPRQFDAANFHKKTYVKSAGAAQQAIAVVILQ